MGEELPKYGESMMRTITELHAGLGAEPAIGRRIPPASFVGVVRTRDLASTDLALVRDADIEHSVVVELDGGRGQPLGPQRHGCEGECRG